MSVISEFSEASEVGEEWDETKWSESLEEKIKDLSPSEKEAVKLFWRSVVMRTRAFSEENGRQLLLLPNAQFTNGSSGSGGMGNVRSCNCCPYGYHIDLDFVRYCESLANAKPTDEELRRRNRRRSRKSMEFMLGLESLFDQWDAIERVQAVPEASHESDSPDSLRQITTSTGSPLTTTTITSQHRPRSSSVPRFIYGTGGGGGGLQRSESSSTCSSHRGAESDAAAYMTSMHRRRLPSSINSPPETRAFLRDALEDVCSDFERTLERTSMRRKKGGGSVVNGDGIHYRYTSDRNNNNTTTMGLSNGFHGYGKDKRNGNDWDQYFSTFDSCVAGNKSPRSSRSFTRSHTLPFQRRPSPAEQKYESYVQATVAATKKSPVEEFMPPPPPPPRRHGHAKLLSPSAGEYDKSPSIDRTVDADESVRRTAATVAAVAATTTAASNEGSTAEAQALFKIRQQMALSLQRMKDLEDQVKTIPELQTELSQLRSDNQLLQQSLQRKDEELQRARDHTRLSSSPSPVTSPKASPILFTPQRISPISLESLGARLRTNSSSSEKTVKTVMKRDVGTMCGLHSTRDVAVGSPVLIQRSVGTSPAKMVSLKEILYTQYEMQESIKVAIREYEEQRMLTNRKNLISVGTQMFVPERNMRESGMQTAAEKPVLKYAVGVMAKPATRENFVTCKPDTRTVGCSEDRITDILCEKCSKSRRTVACNTDTVGASTPSATGEKSKAVSLKLLETTGRSNTFSLGENEKLAIVPRKTVGTQYSPVVVHNVGSQTSLAVVHSVGVQNSPETHSSGSQSHIETSSRQTDTRDLIRLCCTQTNTEEISPPRAPTPPPKPAIATRCIGSNTEALKMVDNGVNTMVAAVSIRHSSSNTEEVPKRDIGCGVIVKPHISIACADNYCDSCKDAIKNLAKDFSKVQHVIPASPERPARHRTTSADSRIPRPKHLSSPSPARKQFQRQNTYTVTPSPTPSPLTEKKTLAGALPENPPAAVSSYHQNESSPETQSFIPEATKQKATSTQQPLPSAKNDLPFELLNAGEDDLIVREEKRVSISWSRDASPAPSKSLENSFNEKMVKSTDSGELRPSDATAADVSKGARRKTPPALSQKSSQSSEEPTGKVVSDKGPSKALLQKLAMVEAEPRDKFTPSKELMAALKIINESLLKKMGAKPFSSASLKASKATIQQEWFRISSTEEANPHEVEDYLDSFESLSVPLLEYCVNLADNNGNTAMHYAVSHGNFDVVSILLDSKVCNVNQMNNAGYTCVMLVSLAKLRNAAHRTVVERLFQMSDVNIRAKKHCQTALMLAVSHGNFDMAEMLLAAGADINIQDEDGSTALMCAAEHGRVDLVKLLLSQSDCDSLVQDMDGSTAFKIAWQAGHRDIGLLLYVHEQMLRSKMPNRGEGPLTPSLSPKQGK